MSCDVVYSQPIDRQFHRWIGPNCRSWRGRYMLVDDNPHSRSVPNRGDHGEPDEPRYSELPRKTPRPAMPTILWSLLLLAGALIWLGSGPLHAPPLTALVPLNCNPRPVFQGGWMRGQRSPFYYSCKSATQSVFQRTRIPVGAGNDGAFQRCSSDRGVVTIWRAFDPDPYANFIFQSECGGKIYATYQSQIASYVARQISIRTFAWFLIGLSVAALIVQLRRRVASRDVGRQQTHGKP